MNGDAFLEEVLARYRDQKSLADRALAQVPDDAFFHEPASGANSLAVIVKHLTGNLRSRWKDLLTTDGEKPDRNRDAEFETGATDSRDSALAAWEAAWRTLFDSLSSLDDADMGKTVVIRGEPHSVIQAIGRNLTHTAQHVGQIVYVAKLLSGDAWKTLSIPRGASEQFTRRLRSQRI
jgi:uncharacterized damage-inducible protein DinB